MSPVGVDLEDAVLTDGRLSDYLSQQMLLENNVLSNLLMQGHKFIRMTHDTQEIVEHLDTLKITVYWLTAVLVVGLLIIILLLFRIGSILSASLTGNRCHLQRHSTNSVAKVPTNGSIKQPLMEPDMDACTTEPDCVVVTSPTVNSLLNVTTRDSTPQMQQIDATPLTELQQPSTAVTGKRGRNGSSPISLHVPIGCSSSSQELSPQMSPRRTPAATEGGRNGRKRQLTAMGQNSSTTQDDTLFSDMEVDKIFRSRAGSDSMDEIDAKIPFSARSDPKSAAPSRRQSSQDRKQLANGGAGVNGR